MTVRAVQCRCLSAQELEEMRGMLSIDGPAIDASFKRVARETHLRMLLERNYTALDDRPQNPLPADGSRLNRGAGISEYGLTRTGRFDFRSGDRVIIHALVARPALNGSVGVVVDPGFSKESGRCAVCVGDKGLSVKPSNLKLVLYAWNETVVKFMRPSGTLVSQTVGWCRTNGFDEVRPGRCPSLYAGPWWDSMDAVEQARVLAHVDLAAADPGGGEARIDAGEDAGAAVQEQFLDEVSAGDVLSVGDVGTLAMEMVREEERSQRSAESYVSDEDDEFADLAHELGGEAADGIGPEDLGGEWNFSAADLDVLARLGVGDAADLGVAVGDCPICAREVALQQLQFFSGMCKECHDGGR